MTRKRTNSRINPRLLVEVARLARIVIEVFFRHHLGSVE
jgi:hypothetical protein